MSTKTTFLGLELPENNEFFNTWDTVNNDNLVKLENKSESHDNEIIAARGTKGNMAAFLAVSHNTDGTLKATGEAVDARNSPVYGSFDGDGDFELKGRLDLPDFETYYARYGKTDLREALAIRKESYVLDGTKDANGLPTWLGKTGANAQIDGSATEVHYLIDGHLCRIRTLESVEVVGGAATYYLVAKYIAAGITVHDGDSAAPPPADANGITSNGGGSRVNIFADATVDFTTKNVKAGDILRVLGTTTAAGDYVLEEVAPGGESTWLKIKGVFKESLASLDYIIIDPIMAELSVEATETVEANKITIGELEFDGGAITEVRARHFGKVFVGEWRSVDVSGGAPTFEEIWTHRLGSQALSVTIQVSQADDDSAPIEHLSLAVADTVATTYTEGGGDVDTFTLDNDGEHENSVRMKADKNRIWLKNWITAVFYKAYDDSVKQSGFIRVIVTRKD